MRILLAGDSWGIGVFKTQDSVYGPTGEGIHTLLEARGHSVINISKGGGSNYLMIDRLNGQWGQTGRCLFGVESNLKIDIDYNDTDHIVFLQTDIFRERHYYGKQHPTDMDTNWKILEQEFVDSLMNYDSIDHIINSYFQNFYKDLNNIGIEHNKKVLMIGGWSQLHPSINNYSNLVPALVSATKLLISDVTQDGYISDPEWFNQLDKEKPFMEKFGNEFKQLAIDNADKLDLIYKNWHEVHPDINGYQQIVDELLPYLAKKN